MTEARPTGGSGMLDAASTALLVIDVQQAFDDGGPGRRRNNPDAEANVAGLLAAFRAVGAAIFHIRHASIEPGSRLRPDQPGFAVKPGARERDGEPVLTKQVNSAFIGTDLEARLRRAGIDALVVCGATTNHCVETTVRMAGNLGFNAVMVRDAAWTYDRVGPDGDHHTAAAVHAMSLANLSGEFAAILTTAEVVRTLAGTSGSLKARPGPGGTPAAVGPG